ncbi:MAG: FG-GAP repeat domain-containing protein, partial [Rhodanobacteraceae bacterium]
MKRIVMSSHHLLVRASLFCGLIAFAVLAHATEPALSPSASPMVPFQGPPDLTLPVVSQAMGLSIADLNDDGLMDIVVLSGETSSLTIMLGQPGPKFAVAKRIELSAGASASGLELGDFNEDGKLDIVVCHHDTDEIWLFLGKGDGTFRPPDKVRVAVTKPHCHAIVAADMNHDRHLDVIFAESSDNYVWILLGNGKGKFEKARGSPIATDA